MSPGPDRISLGHSLEDVPSRAQGRARESGGQAEGREAEGPTEKGDHGVKERREAEEHRQVQEHPRVVDAREADSSNRPRK